MYIVEYMGSKPVSSFPMHQKYVSRGRCANVFKWVKRQAISNLQKEENQMVVINQSCIGIMLSKFLVDHLSTMTLSSASPKRDLVAMCNCLHVGGS